MERPDSLDHYKILNLIGRGGTARVYRCQDTRDAGKVVAVKVFAQSDLSDPTALKNFEREIQAMGQLRHPYIVPLIDYSLTPSQSYLVMPYFENGSVADQLAHRLYSPAEAARLLSQMAFALDYAHSQGYIHRDLKPSNLMLDEDGQSYLADFGLAKAIGAHHDGDQLFGTAAYMAPELAEGSAADVRSDVYALGIVLCELLTGHRPFDAENQADVMYQHRRALPPTPSQLNPDTPAALDAVVMGALSKQPGDRPQSAGELARAFSAAVATLPPQVQGQRARRLPRPSILLTPVKKSTGLLSVLNEQDSPTRPFKPRELNLLDTEKAIRVPSPPVIPPTPPRRQRTRRLPDSPVDWLVVGLAVLAVIVLGMLAYFVILALAR